MSNRVSRRREVALARQELANASLLTWLVPADANLDVPLLSKAVKWWRANIFARRPSCPCCRVGYVSGAEVGMFLLSIPAVNPTAASVSAFCTECARDPAEVERHCVRVLRHLLPGGKFIDPASP